MARTAFEFVAARLEQLTEFDGPEARGTVRLALKEAGLDARSVTTSQIAVVVERVLPYELRSRGVADGERVARTILADLKGFRAEEPEAAESPEDVFRRLAGR
jgi:hypothetical protein